MLLILSFVSLLTSVLEITLLAKCPLDLGKISAFIAGNIEHQLLNQINQNSPLEGVSLVLHTYKKLHEKKLFPKMENFETWLLWQEKGDLEKSLKNITHHSSGSPTAPAE